MAKKKAAAPKSPKAAKPKRTAKPARIEESVHVCPGCSLATTLKIDDVFPFKE